MQFIDYSYWKYNCQDWQSILSDYIKKIQKNTRVCLRNPSIIICEYASLVILFYF